MAREFFPRIMSPHTGSGALPVRRQAVLRRRLPRKKCEKNYFLLYCGGSSVRLL